MSFKDIQIERLEDVAKAIEQYDSNYENLESDYKQLEAENQRLKKELEVVKNLCCPVAYIEAMEDKQRADLDLAYMKSEGLI